MKLDTFDIFDLFDTFLRETTLAEKKHCSALRIEILRLFSARLLSFHTKRIK